MSDVKSTSIRENVRRILEELPSGVTLEAAAKGCLPDAVQEAISAGVKIIGESHIQEAEIIRAALGTKVEIHLIGHLQKNKVKKAVQLFNLIESLDSLELALEIDKQCRIAGRIMPVLIEVNSGRETQKTGVMPESVEALVKAVASFSNLKLTGLMTVGPYTSDPEGLRPYFSETRELFQYIKSLDLPGVEMKYLSMGMSDSYKIAIGEGANLVRIGTKIFGART